MTTVELTRKIVIRLGKIKFLILLCGIAMGALGYFYAKSQPSLYSGEASIYPLTNGKSTSASGGLLSTLTGGSGGGDSKNLSGEASISLEDLANSRKIKEEVVMMRLKEFSNQTIASLLIQDYNKHVPAWGTKLEMPTSETDLKHLGTKILTKGMLAKTNKSDMFQISFTTTAKELIEPITNLMVDRISDFFIDLKVKKARSDYEFSRRKYDSLRSIRDVIDRRAVVLNNKTMFVPPEKIEYQIPKENLINEKTTIVGIYNGAAGNKEDALWRLQRATPILEILDRASPPYDPIRPSTMMYAGVGFIAGIFLFTIFFLIDIFYRFSKSQVNTAIFGTGDMVIDEETTTLVVPENDVAVVKTNPGT